MSPSISASGAHDQPQPSESRSTTSSSSLPSEALHQSGANIDDTANSPSRPRGLPPAASARGQPTRWQRGALTRPSGPIEPTPARDRATVRSDAARRRGGFSAPPDTRQDPRSSAANTSASLLEPPIHRTHSTIGNRKPKVYKDCTVRYGLSVSTNEPASLQLALANKNWKHAMDDEYLALMKTKTWHLVPHKQGINLIDCKWVYKIKRKLMEQLIGIKLDQWQKVLNKDIA